jgi:hypothetical protein
VSSLGDVLELIFGPDPAISVHAIADERFDHDVGEAVSERFLGEQPTLRYPRTVWLMAAPAVAIATVAGTARTIVEKVRRRPPEPEPVQESRLAVWLGTTGRARIERTWDTATGPELRTTVATVGIPVGAIDGRLVEPGLSASLWQEPRWPAPGATDVERLFSHATLREIVVGLELERPREDELAGRPVVVVEASRRQPHDLWPHWLPFGAEHYELSFDREFGSLLAFRAFAGGASYESVTVTEITYGALIDQRMFDRP